MLDFGKHGGVFKSEILLSGSAGESVTLRLDEGGTSLLRSRLCRSFFKTTARETLLERVRSAVTVGELEEISKKYYLCDVCVLDGVNLFGAKKIFEVVVETLYRYPMLRSQLCYIGSYEGYKDAVDGLCRGDDGELRRFGMQYLCDGESAEALGRLTRAELESCPFAESMVAMAFNVFGFFDAIIINDESFCGYGYIKTANDVRYSERVGFHPKGCDSVESVVYHEIGHMLDYTCKVTLSSEFSSFYNSIDKKRTMSDLSEYACTSPEEFFAEAVAEYFSSPFPREISRECIKILDNLYYKRIKL